MQAHVGYHMINHGLITIEKKMWDAYCEIVKAGSLPLAISGIISSIGGWLEVLAAAARVADVLRYIKVFVKP
jgi:hypothetical protein